MKKWEPRTAKIAVVTKNALPKEATHRGFSRMEMQAWVPEGATGLGLTPHLEHEKRYALTHLASGYTLSSHPWKKGPLVAQLILELEVLPIDWRVPQKEIKKLPLATKEQIINLIAEAIRKDER